MVDWQIAAGGLFVPLAAADGVYLARKDGVRFTDWLPLAGATYDDAGVTITPVPFAAPVATQAFDYTLGLGDADALILMDSSVPVVLEVPEDTTADLPVGTTVRVVQVGIGTVTLSPEGAVVLNAAIGLTLLAQYGVAWLSKLGPDLWLAYGDLAP